MTAPDLVIVAYDQTDTQGVADSVVKYLRRDHGYEVVVVGPGHGRELGQLDAATLERARFFLELDAVSGVLYHAEGLERLRCPKLAWFVDSHKKPHFHQRIAEDFDLVCFTMWAWGGLFGARGRWLPVHFDPEWIGPRGATTPRFDVGFVGSRPKERTRVLQEIAARHGFSLLLETTTGPREKELTADLYAQCRVVFNQHVANDLNFRMVEAPACRRLLLTDAQRNGQYELFRDREHVVYYKDDRDLEEALVHYLRHEDERERIAAAGHALATRLHTTPARVRELVFLAEELVRERGGAPRGPSPSTSSSVARAAAGQQRVMMLVGEVGRSSGADDLALALPTALAGRGCAVDVLALAPPAAQVAGVRVHVARGPRLPRLDSAPRARALLENVPLLDAAKGLLRASTSGDVLVVALRAEHAVAAKALGRPFVVLVDAGDPLPPGLVELRSARAIFATCPAALDAVGRADGNLGSRVRLVADLGGLATGVLEALPARTEGAGPPPASPTPAEVHYDREYMLRYGYCTRSPEEARLKQVQAGLIARVLQPRRALVAGCAAGELLLPLLARGVDAWGFDAAEGLESFVYPEVRERVLPFDVAEVGNFPSERAGGEFDTFVAIDLFEHVDEARVDRMLDGVARRFERLALVISSSPAFEGHVCVKPFPWWLARMEARGFELLPEPSALAPEEAGTYGVKRFAGVLKDMSEQLVFFRRRAPVTVAERRTPEPVSVAQRAPGGGQGPDVSIALVCCDRPDVLEATLETTRAALVGSSLRLEWLAFDNGSSEPVRRVLEDAALDVVLRAGKNLGLAPALDALYRAAQGRYLLTLEDDWACLSPSHGWLDLAVAILDAQPDVGVVRLRRMDDGQCGHFKRHRREVALRHHPWSVEPFPSDVVETRALDGERFFVAGAAWANWTHNPTLCRREVRDWLGRLAAYLPDPRDHRPRGDHPGLEGAIDRRWRTGPWKVAKLVDGPFTHIGDRPAVVEAS